MGLNPFASKKKPFATTPSPKPQEAVPAESEITAQRGLPSLFEKGITLQKEREEILQKGMEEGLAFFEEFNEARMKLAFENFTQDMKKALYEVIFFLHVNDERFAEVKFTGIEVEHVYGITREHEYEATANLYVEDAPHGVAGIENLPEMFREEFFEYIQGEFDTRPRSSDTEFCPIVSISSLGSIGTIAHKPFVSDLDLQIQYELEPFKIDVSAWNDEQLLNALKQELSRCIQRSRIQKKIHRDAWQHPEVRGKLQKNAHAQVQKTYPLLYKYLIKNQGDYREDLMASQGSQLRQSLLHEMMALIKRDEQRKRAPALQHQEELLKKRKNIIQNYLEKKFPKAEIYLFLADNPNFRKGHHGTTLESKEASGSAYELILTYDVLMSGIQFTPMVPTHFIVPKVINDSPTFYERTMDYIRFGVVGVYDPVVERLTDLGATPSVTLRYVLAHGGMIYWESFKAASGNLAKALLNLLRIEMLHEKKYLFMIIELIKNPAQLNRFIQKPAKKSQTTQDFGLSSWELLELEKALPLLLKDPWWFRYKVLKIAFGELPYLDLEERQRISKIIDLCFALHIKVSEVFKKAGDTRRFDSYRSKFLVDFLKRAFPEGSPQRVFLQHINIGETKAVIEFENELKFLFKSSLDRVLEIEAQHGIPDESNQKEFEIWYHYYQKNFEPPSNMVRKSILHHLKIPRLRLQAAYQPQEKSWLMRSMQTESKQGKRFDTFGVLDDLPDEVDLLQAPSFTYALADCVLNSYYGYVNQGSLKEQKSIVEFDAAATYKAELIDENYAYIRPDNVARIADRISEFFVYRTYHYLETLKPKYCVELFFMLHLMRFGQLSILYRDNLTNWYLDEFEIPTLRKFAHDLHLDPAGTFKNKHLKKIILLFLKDRDLNLSHEHVKTQFWFNPNSAITSHAANKVVAKEEDLSKIFKAFVHALAQK